MAPVSVSVPQSASSSNLYSSASTVPNSSPSISSNNNVTTGSKQVPKNGSSRRIEINPIVIEFQKKLGNKWDDYQVAVSLFLVGKLSRNELVTKLNEILKNDKSTIRMHNQLLLANLANSLRDEPLFGFANSGFGNQQQQLNGINNKKRKNNSSNKSSQYELIQKNILALPIRERKRLKMITKESGKKNMNNSIITLTRQSIVPRIPIITNFELHKQNLLKNLEESAISTTNNTSQWGQDVLHGIQVPLCSESYELPDMENLKSRVLSIQRENGLLGDLNEKTLEFLSLSLETFLKNILGNAIDIVKYRNSTQDDDILHDNLSNSQKITDDNDSSNNNNNSNANNNTNNNNNNNNNENSDNNNNDNDSNGDNLKSGDNKKKRSITLTIEDLNDTLVQQPHLIQQFGTNYYLNTNWLKNDDDLELQEIYSNPVSNTTNVGVGVGVTNGNSSNSLVTPSKISYLLKDKEELKSRRLKESTVAGATTTTTSNKSIGSQDELNWVIHELLTTN